MTTPQVLSLLARHQQNLSDEVFANRLGLRGSTLWRYKNGRSFINIESRQKIFLFALSQEDAELLGSLLAYRVETRELTPLELKTLGLAYLSVDSARPEKLAAEPENG